MATECGTTSEAISGGGGAGDRITLDSDDIVIKCPPILATLLKIVNTFLKRSKNDKSQR